MIRSDEEMTVRDEKCREIEDAFKRAQVGTRHQRMPGMPYSGVDVWLNYGFGGQRRVIITIDDESMCRVFLSPLYGVPEGKSGDDMMLNVQIPLLFALPITSPDLGNEVVRRVREATLQE
jgi:hypothetical protein